MAKKTTNYHKHPNGGGLVADTASVEDSAYIGPNAKVYGNAKIYIPKYVSEWEERLNG